MSEENQTAKSNVTGLSFKDFLIPFSIIIAGALMGAGLYLSGITSLSPQPPVAAVTNEPSNPLPALALAAGVDGEEFQNCVDSQEMMPQVEEDIADAVETGGQGTPWGVIIGPGGKKYPIPGALPQASLEALIEVAKSEAAEGPGTSAEELMLENINPVTADDHIKGNIDAAVMVVEYSDYDCPFCTRFHATMNAIVAKYPANEVAWVYRQFPLDALHPNARTVALAAECVAKLGGNDAFWSFTDGYLR